jgi:hypothetical protein
MFLTPTGFLMEGDFIHNRCKSLPRSLLPIDDPVGPVGPHSAPVDTTAQVAHVASAFGGAVLT